MTSELDFQTEACLRAGWIYYLKTTFGKVWHRKWLTIRADGTMVIGRSRKAKRRKAQTYDLKRDCMFIRTAGQCQHLLPPAQVESSNLMELLFTGDRRLALCGMTPEDSELWHSCIETARSETSLPKPKFPQVTQKEDEPTEEGGSWCCLCTRQSSSVKVIEQSSTG